MEIFEFSKSDVIESVKAYGDETDLANVDDFSYIWEIGGPTVHEIFEFNETGDSITIIGDREHVISELIVLEVSIADVMWSAGIESRVAQLHNWARTYHDTYWAREARHTDWVDEYGSTVILVLAWLRRHLENIEPKTKYSL